MSITVLIPCFKRADFLTTALESVRRQTALNYIDEIIVSENSTEIGSKIVCEKFKDLRIRYIQQSKSLSAVEHLSWLIDQSYSKFTAMLHDDDWWYDTHLESGLNELMKDGTQSYFSNFVFTQNEIFKSASFHHPSLMTYICGDQSAFDNILLELRQVATLCYLYTPFHMSSMIAFTDSLKEANHKGLRDSKPWYADRIIYPYLSSKGKVSFNPQVLCAIRQHATNDAKTIDIEQRIFSHREGSRKIKDLAYSFDIDVMNEWANIKSKILEDEWNEVRFIYKHYFGEEHNSIFSFESSDVYNSSKVFINRFLKNILPYGLVSRYNKYIGKKVH